MMLLTQSDVVRVLTGEGYARSVVEACCDEHFGINYDAKESLVWGPSDVEVIRTSLRHHDAAVATTITAAESYAEQLTHARSKDLADDESHAVASLRLDERSWMPDEASLEQAGLAPEDELESIWRCGGVKIEILWRDNKAEVKVDFDALVAVACRLKAHERHLSVERAVAEGVANLAVDMIRRYAADHDEDANVVIANLDKPVN